ncbi:MAG: hypothetical protein ABUM51_10550 [Bacteroidota bacterium]
MKKLTFSALIFCGLLITAKTNGQSSGEIISAAEEERSPAATFIAYSEANSNIVRIRWQTSNEINVDHFVVEHSLDNIHFGALHEVVGKGGTGNQSYEDEDGYPAVQANYYRLVTVSKDGNSFYSASIPVNMTGKKIPVITPTVLHMGETLRINPYYREPVMVNVFNQSGMRVAGYMVNSSAFNVNTSGWGKGIFFYRISDASHPLIDAGKIMVF